MRRPNSVFGDDYAVIRDVLTRARLEAGLSQRALARRLGKSPSHIALIERGQRRVDTLELCLLAVCMRVPATTLFARIIERLDALRAAEDCIWLRDEAADDCTVSELQSSMMEQ